MRKILSVNFSDVRIREVVLERPYHLLGPVKANVSSAWIFEK